MFLYNLFGGRYRPARPGNLSILEIYSAHSLYSYYCCRKQILSFDRPGERPTLTGRKSLSPRPILMSWICRKFQFFPQWPPWGERLLRLDPNARVQSRADFISDSR